MVSLPSTAQGKLNAVITPTTPRGFQTYSEKNWSFNMFNDATRECDDFFFFLKSGSPTENVVEVYSTKKILDPTYLHHHMVWACKDYIMRH
jgi:hypothetical protein